MSGNDYTTFSFGGTVFPLVASSSNSLLADADPALARILDFIATVIRTYAGERWGVEFEALGLPSADIIQTVVPYDPIPQLHEAQYKFPLLAIYRASAKIDDHTVNTSRISDRWGLDFILPPLTAGMLERLHPILHAVEAIVLDRTSLEHDPSFDNDAPVFGGVTGFKVLDREILTLERQPFTDRDPTYRLLHMTLQVGEDQAPNGSSFEPIGGVDAHITPDAATPLTELKVDNP